MGPKNVSLDQTGAPSDPEIQESTGRPFIRIGGLGPLTLPGLTWAGSELRDGMTLAVEKINASGGVLGRSLTLLFQDTQGKPDVGLAAVQQLLDEGVDAFAGEFHSVVADGIVDAIQSSGRPFVCASATMDSITARRHPMVFRLAPPQSYGWSIYADFLAGQGFRHVAAVQEDNVYWNSGSQVIEDRLGELGVRFTRLLLTGKSAVACIKEVEEARSESPAPDMLLMLVAYPEPFISLAREAYSRGLAPPTCFVGDPAGRVAYRAQSSSVDTHAIRVPFLSYARSPLSTQEGQRITREFQHRFGRIPTFVAFEGYDSVLVIAWACAYAGITEPGAICDALRKTSVAGTRGTITFSTEADGIVHQQWKWPPVCVMAYSRAQQTFADADVLWDAEHGQTLHRRLTIQR